MYGDIPLDLAPIDWHECHNAGPCCYGCPHFDQCENHEPDES